MPQGSSAVRPTKAFTFYLLVIAKLYNIKKNELNPQISELTTKERYFKDVDALK